MNIANCKVRIAKCKLKDGGPDSNSQFAIRNLHFAIPVPAKDFSTAGQHTNAMLEPDRVWRERGLRSAVLHGDERAWQTLYDESFAGLYRYVCWRCAGLRDVADDIVQETWLTAVRRVAVFEPD